ncbi:uncharacterized protein BXZ73DRAFT_80349 [Epithele typhae]|uniref:uncharacterized protein n=1 Tax=Epithele typhae TaxID=378194 RepID=UPI002007C86B|nr:uncharacterized protein BXZ73DRAFT_80349 [Epithele typhae]KAH9919477.1 hypothetical protein BXZ73DRAFT_80349 [Epithele typhae]
MHGLDVACTVLAAVANPDRGVGQRWLLTDTHVYDWWGWQRGGAPRRSRGGAGAHELPRPPEILGRAMDSVEFIVYKSISDVISCREDLVFAASSARCSPVRIQDTAPLVLVLVLVLEQMTLRFALHFAALVRPCGLWVVSAARFKFLGDHAPRLRARADSNTKSKTEPVRPSCQYVLGGQARHAVDVSVGAAGVVVDGHVPCPPPAEQIF